MARPVLNVLCEAFAKQWELRTSARWQQFLFGLALVTKNSYTFHTVDFSLRCYRLARLRYCYTPTHLIKAFRVTKKLWHFFCVFITRPHKGSMWKVFHCGNIVQSLLKKRLLCDWEAKLPAKRAVFLIKVPLSAPISAAFFVMDDTKGGKTGVWSATMKGPPRDSGNNIVISTN